MTDPNQDAANAAIDAGLVNRPVTVAQLSATLKTALGFAFASIGSVGATLAAVTLVTGGGVFINPAAIQNASITAQMLAPGVGGGVIVVPARTVTGSGAASTTSTDYLVCLNGPTQVQLEVAPPAGTTHVLKDCRPGGGSVISVLPSGSDTIDGTASVTFSAAHQAMVVTYPPGSVGWQIY